MQQRSSPCYIPFPSISYVKKNTLKKNPHRLWHKQRTLNPLYYGQTSVKFIYFTTSMLIQDEARVANSEQWTTDNCDPYHLYCSEGVSQILFQ